MLTALPFVLAAAQIPPADHPPLTLHGECIYPPAIADAAPNASQVICDSVEISARGVAFRQGEWNARSRFVGSWQGGVLTVTSIQPRNTKPSEAQGECRIDYSNGRISLVSCTAFGGGRGWVANFRNVPS